MPSRKRYRDDAADAADAGGSGPYGRDSAGRGRRPRLQGTGGA